MLAYNPKNMTEDEREHLLSTVGQAHTGLSEVALKLRLGLPPKTSVLKTAIKAERVAFDLKRSLQRLEVKDVETITRRAPVLPEVRRGGKVVDPESLLRHGCRYATAQQLRAKIGELVGWMDFYNRCRPHSSLNGRTPEEAYTSDEADRSLGLRPTSGQPNAA